MTDTTIIVGYSIDRKIDHLLWTVFAHIPAQSYCTQVVYLSQYHHFLCHKLLLINDLRASATTCGIHVVPSLIQLATYLSQCRDAAYLMIGDYPIRPIDGKPEKIT